MQLFAFTALLEAATAVAFNATPVPLSEEFVIECAGDYPCDDENRDDKNCSQADPRTAASGFCNGGNEGVVAGNVLYRYGGYVLPASAYPPYTAGLGLGVNPCPSPSWFTAKFGPRGVRGVPGSAGFRAYITEARVFSGCSVVALLGEQPSLRQMCCARQPLAHPLWHAWPPLSHTTPDRAPRRVLGRTG